MTQLRAFRIRNGVCIAGLLLSTAACGSSTDSTADSTNAGSDSTLDTTLDATTSPEAAATTVPDEAEPAPTAAPAESGGGSGDMQIELDDGRTWSLTTTMCTYNPDATGPAAAIFNVAGFNDGGAELNAIEAWPFDGSTENGTAAIGNFVAENEDLYIFVEPTAAMVDGTLELTTDYQTDVFYEEGADPIGTVTVRCAP